MCRLFEKGLLTVTAFEKILLTVISFESNKENMAGELIKFNRI